MAHPRLRYMRKWITNNRWRLTGYHKTYAVKKRAIIIKAKNKPCTDCKRKFPYYVMDLDHVRGKKLFSLGDSTKVGQQGFGRIKAEIAKCQPVCANCHRIRTHKRAT